MKLGGARCLSEHVEKVNGYVIRNYLAQFSLNERTARRIDENTAYKNEIPIILYAVQYESCLSRVFLMLQKTVKRL